jgi:quinohemoprotein ethanol dehydrogenase
VLKYKIDFWCIPSLCALVFLTAGGSAQSQLASVTASSDNRKDSAVSGLDPQTPSMKSWPKSGGNLFNQNYSPLTQINRENVVNLKGVWRARLDGSGTGAKYSGEAQPVMEDGVVYIVTGADDVFAISVKTGEILWKYKANLDETITTVCCGWTSRGVALGEGKVYVGQLDGRLVALDRKSGKPAWSIQAERWQDGYTITAAPLYYDGMLIVGFAGGENGTRGRVKAFDAKDGHLLWTFYTIPGPGELGHDTWPQDNDAWKHGGAGVWQTPAVDPELGLIYFTTGNPGPDFNGHIRPGNNLFSVSMMALEAKTGKYRWHFQQVHHDIWDYDSPNPVILFDVKVNGRVRKSAAEASKTGWVYILDRVTGKPLLGIDEKPVAQESRQNTSATQPFPRGDAFVPHQVDIAPEDFPLVNQGRIFTPFWSDGVVAKPSPRGGANWPSSSYDRATNYYYVCGSDSVNLFKGGEENQIITREGERYLGGAFAGAPIPGTGIFAALDMKTNRLVWRQAWKDACYSGSATTAGGLVFVGRNDGRLTALNSATGKRLWEFQTGAGMNAPASVFEYEGEEYVAAYSAGSLFAGAPRGDSLWLFSLKGAMQQAAPASTTPAATASAPPATADLANGQKIFGELCSTCHGSSGEGGHGGPALTSVRDPGKIVQMVQQGGAQMPSLGSSLAAKDIQDVSAYVREKLVH